MDVDNHRRDQRRRPPQGLHWCGTPRRLPQICAHSSPTRVTYQEQDFRLKHQQA